jgi:two-component system sensor histidine kinase KdpD
MSAVDTGTSRWLWRYGSSTVALAALVTVLHFLRPALNQTSIALGLVLLVVLVAARAGRFPALYVAILAGLSFNFFFIGPFYSFRIHRTEDVVAFLAFILTAVFVGQLSTLLEKRGLQSAELQRSEQLKTALLDAVTHDLRTPLTSIKAAITTVRSEKVSAEVQQELFAVIEQESDRLNHFIQGMMDLAKLEAGQILLQSRTVAADEVIEDALQRAGNLLDRHPVETSVEPGLPDLKVDPRLISQVLFTLIENSAKYSPPETPITVSVRRSRDHSVCFAVSDEGPGINPELRDQVFQKFFRAGTRPGFGVGLAIAHGIVQAHQGKIWIEDNPQGRGACVQFQIPLREAT